ncbi:hypothetical protein [Puia sp.]|uniref:hypothetical protein n=1 Tax=Puia sp. TaxID=2045100 RepID=UPI002F3F25DD
MKKAGAILLLLIIGYTQWGYYSQFIILQWRMKEAAREAWVASLPDDAFLRVSLAEINAHGRWEEAGKECWYKEHLYDIIRQRNAGDTTWLFCLDDDNEEKLIRQSGEVTRANLDHPDKRAGHSLSISTGDLVCETVLWRIPSVAPDLPHYISGGCEQLPIRYSEILLPPPRA